MIFDSTNFLFKINVFFMCEIVVKDSCEKFNEKFDVSKFERFVFSLIKNGNNFDLIIKREIDFHLRIYENVML